MIIRKRTCGTPQSQCRIRGFLLIEVMIAVGVLAMIGLLIQQQYISLVMRQYDYEGRVHSLLQMRSLLEQRLKGRVLPLGKGSLEYTLSEKAVVTDSGEIVPGCRLVTVTYGKQDMALTTVVRA